MWHRIIYDASFAFLSDNMNPNLRDVTLSMVLRVEKYSEDVVCTLCVHNFNYMLEQNLL